MGQSTSQQACSNCGTLNNIGDDFCSNCGFALASMPTATRMSNLNAPPVVSSSGRRITGALTPGLLIGTRYNVVQLLGRGGFGAVYLATDNRFPARRVAVKEMGDAQLSPKDRAQAIINFTQEADILSRLQHPNMPAVSDFFEEGGKAYMVMDFIDGRTLDEVQQTAGGPLDEALVMGWALQICEVLAYLHNQPQPIVFRDLKPANIMVTPANQIKLIDFGIARIFKSTAAKDTNSLGSQGYAAPEQYGFEQTDARTDIYALGATLYDLLTDQVPLASFVRKINPQSFISPRQLNPRISPGIEQVVVAAMEVEKSRRYQSADEMARAIAALGFSVVLNSGSMRVPTGPNAMTIASTQPGSYIGSATINPPPTQAGVSTPPALAPWVVPAQQGTQANQYASLSPGTPILPPGGGLPGAPGTPGTLFSTPSPNPRGRVSRRAALIGGGVAVLAAATGIYFFSRQSAAGDTVTVNFAYSTEKSAWLQPALNAFNNGKYKLSGSNKVITVQPTALGSVDSASQILNGQLRPAVWSPASNLEINRLSYKWQQAHGGTSIISTTEQFQPVSLVKSPLVIAAWQQRAQILLNHYQVSTLDWDTLYSAFQVSNWTDVGGESGWGPVKFGHTAPTESNSGLLTITLLAYHHFNEERDLTAAQVQDTGYQDYLGVFENAVNMFGSSSGTYLQDDVIDGPGPAVADVIATYESLVLTLQAEAQSRQRQPLLLYYPDVNILSDHPFAVLQGDWVTDEQKQAALQFRDFLLDIPQQSQALSYGFRPANPAVALNASGSPFTSQARLFPGGQPNALQSLAQPPAGDVVDTLIHEWSQQYGDRPIYD